MIVNKIVQSEPGGETGHATVVLTADELAALSSALQFASATLRFASDEPELNDKVLGDDRHDGVVIELADAFRALELMVRKSL